MRCESRGGFCRAGMPPIFWFAWFAWFAVRGYLRRITPLVVRGWGGVSGARMA